jgi:DNA-binding MarR family transcriptional regulator
VYDVMREITRSHGRIMTALKENNRNSGLTSASEGMILGTIVMATEPLTAPRIARGMGYSRQAVHRVAQSLETQGLIEMADNPDHKSAKLLRPTTLGVSVIEKAKVGHAHWVDSAIANVGVDRLIETVELLRMFRRELEAASPEDPAD